MSETSFAREYHEFSAAGDDQLIALADTEDAAKRVYQRDHVRLSPIVLGIDPAGLVMTDLWYSVGKVNKHSNQLYIEV